MWEDVLGLEDIGNQIRRLVERILEDQEIQAWQVQRLFSNSLGLYCRSKEIRSEVLFFKVGLNSNEIKLLIEMRADILPLGQRRKFIGREWSKTVPQFYPMCGSLDESVYYFMCECEEFSDWRLEVFGKGDYDLEWLARVCTDECFMGIRSLA